MSYKSSDFYCDVQKLDDFCTSFKPEIDELIRYFEYVKNKVKSIESDKAWEGASFEAFKESFMSYETSFLMMINSMIQYTTNLASIEKTVITMIETRNQLSN